MTRLKLAILIAFPADPNRPHGGVEAVAVNLVRGLAALPELDVQVVTFNPGASAESTWEGATIHRLPQGSGSVLAFATGAGRRAIHQFLHQLKPGLVHAHDTFGIMVKNFSGPRVFTVHGFIHEDTLYSGQKFPWLRAMIWKRIETAAWADQPHIISISPYVRERLRGLTSSAIHDIENPISRECFETKREEAPGVIFCAAAICERKNTLGLVRAFALIAPQHPQARLRWAGPVGDEAYAQSVRTFIAEENLGEKVQLLGSMSSDHVREEMSRAAVFALLSFEEGAPMCVAEAMAAGVPVIASNRCGMPYMMRDGETGVLVDPNNIQEVARCLDALLADSSRRSEMGRRARTMALEIFHPARVAARTLSVYQQMVLE